MAFGWMGATMALASVVKNPNSSCSPSTGALFGPRTPRQRVHNPAKANSGRSSLSANHVGVLRGVVGAYGASSAFDGPERAARLHDLEGGHGDGFPIARGHEHASVLPCCSAATAAVTFSSVAMNRDSACRTISLSGA